MQSARFELTPAYCHQIFSHICRRFNQAGPDQGVEPASPLSEVQGEIARVIESVQVVTREFFKNFFGRCNRVIARDCGTTAINFCSVLMRDWRGDPFYRLFAAAALLIELYLYKARSPPVDPNLFSFIFFTLFAARRGDVLTESGDFLPSLSEPRRLFREAFQLLSPGVDQLRDPYDSFTIEFVQSCASNVYELLEPTLAQTFEERVGYHPLAGFEAVYLPGDTPNIPQVLDESLDLRWLQWIQFQAQYQPDQQPLAQDEPDRQPLAQHEPDQQPLAQHEPDWQPLTQHEEQLNLERVGCHPLADFEAAYEPCNLPDFSQPFNESLDLRWFHWLQTLAASEAVYIPLYSQDFSQQSDRNLRPMWLRWLQSMGDFEAADVHPDFPQEFYELHLPVAQDEEDRLHVAQDEEDPLPVAQDEEDPLPVAQDEEDPLPVAQDEEDRLSLAQQQDIEHAIPPAGFELTPAYCHEIFYHICRRFNTPGPDQGVDPARPLTGVQLELAQIIVTTQVVTRLFFKNFFANSAGAIAADYGGVAREFCQTLRNDWRGNPFDRLFAAAALLIELYLYKTQSSPVDPNFFSGMFFTEFEELRIHVLTESGGFQPTLEVSRQWFGRAFRLISPFVDQLLSPYNSFPNMLWRVGTWHLYQLLIPNLIQTLRYEFVTIYDVADYLGETYPFALPDTNRTVRELRFPMSREQLHSALVGIETKIRVARNVQTMSQADENHLSLAENYTIQARRLLDNILPQAVCQQPFVELQQPHVVGPQQLLLWPRQALAAPRQPLAAPRQPRVTRVSSLFRSQLYLFGAYRQFLRALLQRSFDVWNTQNEVRDLQPVQVRNLRVRNLQPLQVRNLQVRNLQPLQVRNLQVRNLRPMEVMNPRPLQVENPRPLQVENPQPLQVENPQPLQVENPQPLQVENPQPLQVENPQPLQVENPQPL